jgi:uncharacterized protein (DUF2147 family)
LIRAAVTLCLLLPELGARAAEIEGRWAVFDSDTAQRLSTVEIRRDDNRFVGRILELFLAAELPQDPVCTLCKGAERDRKIRGMQMLWVQPTSDGTQYAGTALDPGEGQVYQCIVTIDSTGKRLSIRGYVGVPLFGRTEDWLRVD